MAIKKRAIVTVISVIIFSTLLLTFFSEKKNLAVSAEGDGVKLPIIMYHSLLNDSKLQNEYVISPEIFENDLKYLKNNGYSFLTVDDLIKYTSSDITLPEKCIILTFDDGYYNNYYYAFPLLKKYNAKAVISPIGSMTKKFTETKSISVSYGNINEDNIKEMVNSGYVEIQNHSYDMHRLTPRKGIGQKAGESDSDYKSKITDDIQKEQDYIKSLCNYTPKCFVYPFGEMSDITEQVIKSMGFRCSMTCTEKTNIITKDPESLFELGRYRRDKDESTADFINRIT